ncbi:unnamed protein product [Paramecium octaurelia]|uniref:LITAF domain-containing protein n=1 Tax=Paramecium octaurelia TaxID=43137 RepID=A0A8S1SNB7_PAROT|nr:unnamed protein product [Paramecium octaurelia]
MQQQNDDQIPLNIPQEQYKLPEQLDEFGQPVMFKCSTCGVQAVSILQHKPGTHTWLCCVTLCIFGAFLAFLPFYIKDCQDVTHVCPACSQPKGVKQFKAC